MKTKKILVFVIACVFIASLFSSCAIDKKCPAYSSAPTVTMGDVA